jgi:hypothetical protein
MGIFPTKPTMVPRSIWTSREASSLLPKPNQLGKFGVECLRFAQCGGPATALLGGPHSLRRRFVRNLLRYDHQS